MKIQKTALLLALLTVCTMQSLAQLPPLNESTTQKSKQFTDVPDRLRLRVSALEDLLKLPVGAKVNVTIAEKFPLVGVVVSKSNPADPTVKSVVVNCTNRASATLTFTRRLAPNGTVSYIGRLLNRHAGDALDIVKEGSEYVIRKKELARIMSE